MARSASFVLGLLVVVALVQFPKVAAETSGSTDPIAFKFEDDETTAEAPSANDPVADSFWSEDTVPADDPESIADESSFAEAPEDEAIPTEAVEEVDPENSVFATDAYGANSTSVGEDGFDIVEDADGVPSTEDSPDAELGDLSLASRGCSTGNPVDDCWRCDPNWASHRQSLASCAVGFGRSAIGGKNGRVYVVTSARDDNPANPARGTLRYAVTRPGPLWITFAYSMTIKLKNELLITSYKTIDGRGVRVSIKGGGGLTIQNVNNVIVHGISISDIKPTGPGRIMSSTSHVGNRGRCDGDAISIFASKNVWIDHCYLARAADGLLDVIHGSTGVSITNNYFTQHDKVMLFGARKTDFMDRNMYVTVAYNIFGPGLVQRMPRVRFGNVHVVNNDYTSGWSNYAIGGSEAPTILSQGNIFNPARGKKQVTQRIDDGGSKYGDRKTGTGGQKATGSSVAPSSVSWPCAGPARAIRKRRARRRDQCPWCHAW